MIVSTQPKEHFWCVEAVNRGGGFVSKFAAAALSADAKNYPLIRPALLLLMEKYPEYSHDQN